MIHEYMFVFVHVFVSWHLMTKRYKTKRNETNREKNAIYLIIIDAIHVQFTNFVFL